MKGFLRVDEKNIKLLLNSNRKSSVINIECRALLRWVISSVGRASPLQGECRGFKSLITHQIRTGSSAG